MRQYIYYPAKKKPFEVKNKHIIYVFVCLMTLFANVALGSWIVSKSKTEYDDRLKSLEGVPDRLATMEGKIDVILKVMRSN